MEIIKGYIDYTGDGSEFGKLPKGIIEEWKGHMDRRPVRLDFGDGTVYAGRIFQSRTTKNLLLTGTDVVQGSSGNIYGHVVSMELGKNEVKLRSNYTEGYSVKTECEAKGMVGELVSRFKDKDWKELL